MKFAGDTAVIRLISNSNESAYRMKVDDLVEWCKGNDLLINVEKTKEIVVDFRRGEAYPITSHYWRC